MKKLNDSFNNTFDNISLSKEKSNDLNIKILNGYKKRKKQKRIVLSVILLLNIMLISTGVVYANEIKEMINNLVSRKYSDKNSNNPVRFYAFSKSKKILNYDANLKEFNCEISDADSVPKNDKCFYYSYEELEDKLSIKLLKSNLFEKKHFLIKNLKRVDGKIASLNLELIKPINNKKLDGNINLKLRIYINTKYLVDTEIPLNEEEYNIEEMKSIYYINNLKVPVYGVDYGWVKKIWFEYDSALYALDIYSSNQKLDSNEEVKNILESLHY